MQCMVLCGWCSCRMAKVFVQEVNYCEKIVIFFHNTRALPTRCHCFTFANLISNHYFVSLLLHIHNSIWVGRNVEVSDEKKAARTAIEHQWQIVNFQIAMRPEYDYACLWYFIRFWWYFLLFGLGYDTATQPIVIDY